MRELLFLLAHLIKKEIAFKMLEVLPKLMDVSREGTRI